MRSVALAAALVLTPFLANAQQADLVVVHKSNSKLYLFENGKPFATFRVSFGGDPKGHKEHEGDERTPEGKYVLDARNANSNYYKAIHISYPNEKDRAAAKARGVDPGGLIMIHGQKNGWGWLAPVMQWINWTDGCIALSNKNMDAVWNAVANGTPIEIKP